MHCSDKNVWGLVASAGIQLRVAKRHYLFNVSQSSAVFSKVWQGLLAPLQILTQSDHENIMT